MNAFGAFSSPSDQVNLNLKRLSCGAKFGKQILLNIPFANHIKFNSYAPSIQCKKRDFKISAALSSDVSKDSLDQGTETQFKDQKFNWYEIWYPVMPVCDLDKSRPHGKTVLGIDIVVWWDKNENEWKVMDDTCPHRLAPLSEGRIDQWGRLQCVYHGWCFGGSGECKFIPQAARDGPPIHTSTRACVAVYPSCVQNKILWFWPNSDQKYKDILSKEKPPYIPEIDDPSFTDRMITRDVPYGYEVLMENIMDASHVPYSHYRILKFPSPPKSLKADREGGIPFDISIKKFSINGFTSDTEAGENFFIPPCVFCAYLNIGNFSNKSIPSMETTEKESSSAVAEKKILLVFLCIPVSPGKSRLIFIPARNFAVWIDRVIPRWVSHIEQNLVVDSDLCLLHVEERKMQEIGSLNWEKACFVPTKADANVVSFRRWLKKYCSGGQVEWGTKFNNGFLPPPPPPPPRQQLMDRYWTHTTICSSCNAAYKNLNVIEMALKVISITCVGIAAVTKTAPAAKSYKLVSAAILCFLASEWLSHFIYKTFHFHDYDHSSI